MDLAVWLSGMGKLVAHWLSSAKNGIRTLRFGCLADDTTGKMNL